MLNAHLRLGRLEYSRSTEKTSTHISLHVDRYVGEGRQAQLLSLFGNDAEVGAITAAIHENHTFNMIFPDGKSQVASFGKDVSCYRGSLSLPGRKQPFRHLIRSFCVAPWQRQRRPDVRPELPTRDPGSDVGNPGESAGAPSRSAVGRPNFRRVATAAQDQAAARSRV